MRGLDDEDISHSVLSRKTTLWATAAHPRGVR